jgi:hypothetical protein
MLDKAPTRRVPGDYDRKWIADDHFDLIVWYTASDVIYGFQLCYDKPRWERALTWKCDKGFSHMEVDSGEDTPIRNRAPVLLPDGSFPAESVMREFERRGAALPIELRGLVLQKITEYANTRKV